MLYALTDGLAGVEDLGKGFDEIRLSPRWPAAQVDNAEVGLTYESSGMHLGYDYRLSSSGIKMNVSCCYSHTSTNSCNGSNRHNATSSIIFQ